MSWQEWVLVVVIAVAILALFGWARWDLMREAGERREFPATYIGYDAADFSWTSAGLEEPVTWVLGPALYDWQEEGDL